MSKFRSLKRKYVGKETTPISFRLPDSMVTKLKEFSVENSYTVTDVVISVLDQFLQQEYPDEPESDPKKKGASK